MGKLNRHKKSLGLVELIAIAIGGMVGGGIFSILGVSATMIGFLTPVAIIIGGIIAMLAAYSYVKLGVYYKDEGATYSFVKRTFSDSPVMASFIGWLVIFGYISTLALYSYTFGSYAISGTDFADSEWIRKGVSWGIILVFTLINVWSVVGMGKIEDIMVYTKLVILLIISLLLIKHGQTDFGTFVNKLAEDAKHSPVLTVLIVSSITFVAYEGFQLVINAVKEMTNPDKNIPRAIYGAILIVISIYVVIALGALFAIPLQNLINGKEYALASGAKDVIGKIGQDMVIFGAVLATSSAISGTMFGSSRQLSVIAEDGFMPKFLAKRNKVNIPINAIITMALLASLLILIGGLKLFLEFGSVTFLMVSILVAITNYIIRDKTGSSKPVTIFSILGLSLSGILILYYELTHNWYQMLFIITVYIILWLSAYFYSREKKY
ncbi:MAG TPA: APC family permease [Bacteroidetes bacterium]|nr:APC family permease [Bacteroidota bacterium]